MTKVYVAGPMRGIKDFNFPAFMSAAGALRALGLAVFNPAERDTNVFGIGVNNSPTGDLKDIAHTGFDLRDALNADLNFITREADAVIVLPGWEASRGAKAEVAAANAIDIPVLTLEEALEVFKVLGTAR
jgi:hypothetical protein